MEELWDYETMVRYLKSQRPSITNKSPIVGPLGVNYNNWRGSDMYYKGSWMLHTLRSQLNNDELWWKSLKGFAEAFKHKNTDTEEIIAWWNKALGKDYTWLWKEYLYHASAPTLLYKLKKKGNKTQIKCKWEAGESDFRLAVGIRNEPGEDAMIYPTTKWQKFTVPVDFESFRFNKDNWYGFTRNLDKKKK